VRLLSDHATVVISGTKIAEEIGISRSAVWRFVQQLRGLGVNIAGHPATGYRLASVPDLLLPEILAPMLQGTLFTRIHHYFRIGSTNTEAMAAAADGEPEGSVFVAEEQTSGRGRGAHRWASSKSDGIYCSVVLQPELSPADALPLSLVAGLAVVSAVEQLTGVAPDLRWPNDVLLDGKKICGILTEMNAEATRVRYVVVGVGLNVNHTRLPPELPDATSLRKETGHSWSRVKLTAALLKSLDREYRALVPRSKGRGAATEVGHGAGEVIRRFEQRSSFARGRRVRVEESGGYQGVTEGLDSRGFLQVRTPQGLRVVLSGGVRPLD
jgi:BirA family transcriptional regulator, biotin operon repressor / biotin---[acetyl-CoA-carboxylase] ligase